MLVPVVCLRIDLADREEDHVAEAPGKQPVDPQQHAHARAAMLVDQLHGRRSGRIGLPRRGRLVDFGRLAREQFVLLGELRARIRIVAVDREAHALVTNSDVPTR
ncbi:hypothetical protein WL56_37825 [Burkholderia cepacia]|nr:hypothetical protein WL56_37825 [Burkholderia cepacia]